MVPLFLVVMGMVWYFTLEFIRGKSSVPSEVAFSLSWLSILGSLAFIVCAALIIRFKICW